jgi:hypothetical protein
MARRSKLANQVQKAIRGEYGTQVKLPLDPFEGFRDKSEPIKVGSGAVSQMTRDPEQEKLDRQRAPRGGFGQTNPGAALTDKLAAEVAAKAAEKKPPIKLNVAPPRSRKSLALERMGVGVHPGTLASLGIPTFIDRRTPEMKAADAARMRGPEPDLDHLKNENAIPATAPHPTGEPRSDEDRIAGLTEQIKRDMKVLAGPKEYYSSKGDREFYEERIRSNRQTISHLEQKRVPAGSPRGGEWTK